MAFFKFQLAPFYCSGCPSVFHFRESIISQHIGTFHLRDPIFRIVENFTKEIIDKMEVWISLFFNIDFLEKVILLKRFWVGNLPVSFYIILTKFILFKSSNFILKYRFQEQMTACFDDVEAQVFDFPVGGICFKISN